MTEKAFRYYRKSLDWTLEQTAQKLGVTISTVFRWERGECRIPTAALKLMKIYSEEARKEAERG